ncbi:MAG: ATP-dependent DNA helicase RecG, partial [Rhodospirillaceae bacterium]|nr:ATP-dependent DNA helicase RecG [Rhodospirillaceae bacterium]
TVVALLAMLAAVEAGRQAALLAPTEILARQHLATLAPLAARAGVAIDLLTGRDAANRRTAVLLGLADGTLPLVVGTHALLQDDVRFQDLALAVIDEQHRFGVDQRLALTEKGTAVDILAMTATPIPRTLQMSAYGDMDVSAIREKPPGRTPVDTRAIPMDRLEEVVDGLARHLATGAKAFWVCPRVEDGGDLGGLTDATGRAATLGSRFGKRVGLVHGRMASADKDAVMTAFADGDVDVLVATTVVEVGVNVPSATLMVIEHAERFGLAQLHQLRGRVGRGTDKSVCLLLYQPPVSDTMRQRLTTIRDTDDGFAIAEADLALRGAGDMLGVKQSGLPDFRLADLPAHTDLLAIAHDDARVLLANDPDLTGPRGEAVRTLLYLWERDAAIRYLGT